jgi:hypothetical protein
LEGLRKRKHVNLGMEKDKRSNHKHTLTNVQQISITRTIDWHEEKTIALKQITTIKFTPLHYPPSSFSHFLYSLCIFKRGYYNKRKHSFDLGVAWVLSTIVVLKVINIHDYPSGSLKRDLV